MSNYGNEVKLFDDFTPLSKKEWEEFVKKDLKGKDYKKLLTWESTEGFEILPYFTLDDSEHLSWQKSIPGEPPYTRGHTMKPGWVLCDPLFEHKTEIANKSIKNSIDNGAESVLFKLEAFADEGMLGGDLRGLQIQSQNDFDTLFRDIKMDSFIPLFQCGMATPAVLAMYLNYLEKNNFNADKCSAYFSYDPFTWLAKYGSLPGEDQLIDDNINQIIPFKKFKPLVADGLFYHSAGATIVQEFGIVLAIGSEFLSRGLKNNKSATDVADAFYARVSAGSLLFPEIAKLRALRTLWNKVVSAYDPEAEDSGLFIHSVTSNWNKSILDPHNNMIRATTEVLSAVIGGADMITAEPYDSHFRLPNEFAKRISRNIHHILKHEAHLAKVADPAAGSWYIEKLTDQIAEKAWDFFRLIENQGGIIKALEGRMIQSAIEASRKEKENAFETQKLTVTGANKYPNKDDELPAGIFRSEFTDSLKKKDENVEVDNAALIESLKKAFKDGASLGDVIPNMLNPQKRLFQPVEPVRLTLKTEALRAAVLKFRELNGRLPKAALLLAGDKKMRKLRALFVQNFLACGGYDIREYQADELQKTIQELKSDKPDIIVLCSSDSEYETLVPPFCEAFSEMNTILVLAGYPEEKMDEYRKAGINYFIHRNSNLVNTLSNLHKNLKIID
ncbi:MAG: methylmalonyl-CoA mutase family protein [Balneolaceae bacterium]